MDRNPLSVMYTNPSSDELWNYEQPDIPHGSSSAEVERLYVGADAEAIGETQKYIGGGIVGLVGVGLMTIVDYPEDIIDLAVNVSGPAFVQILSFTTLRRGLNAIRNRSKERRHVDDVDSNPISILYKNPRSSELWNYKQPDIPPDSSDAETERLHVEADAEAIRETQKYIGGGIVGLVGVGLMTVINYPENFIELAKNVSGPALAQILSFTTLRRGLSIIKNRSKERRHAGEQ